MTIFHVCVTSPMGYMLWGAQVIATGIGFVLMLVGGVCAAAIIAEALFDRIITRVVRAFNLYDAVLATGVQRIQARRKNRAEKTS